MTITRTDQPSVRPVDPATLIKCVKGIRKRLKYENDPEKRYKLKSIKREIKWLIDNL